MRKTKQFKGFLIMIRPTYTIFVLLVSFSGMFFATRTVETSFVLPLVVIGLHYMAICIKDDIEDLDIDLIVDKSRPLVQKIISIKEAYAAWILLHLLALPLSLLIGFQFFLVMLLYIPIGVLYTQRPFRISDRGLIGNAFFVWFSVPLPFAAASVAVRHLSLEVLIAAICLWVWILVIDLLKDFVLLDRNRMETRISFVMNLGVDKASKVYSLITLLFILAFPAIYLALNLNTGFFLAMSLASIWLIYVTVQLLRDPQPAKRLLIRTYFALPPLIAIAFILGVL